MDSMYVSLGLLIL